MDGRETQIDEVWDFVSCDFTCKVRPTAQVDVNAGAVGAFTSNYPTESGRRVKFPLIQVLNIWEFLTSTEPVGSFGMLISWFAILVGETVVPPPIRTG